MSDEIRNVVIAGGGLAGWFSAVRLAQGLRARRTQVSVVEAAPAGGEVDALDALCASTLPAQVLMHAQLGFDEREFMRGAGATFKLGTQFHDWAQPGASHVLPFGDIGARLEAVGFHQFLSRLFHAGQTPDIDDFSVAAQAIRQGRFAHPADDPRSVLSTFEYAHHLDIAGYTRLLRALAGRLGVQAIPGELRAVDRSPDGARIEALRLDGDRRVTGDLFLDCTGPRALLLGEALGVGFESWKQWLPCDRVLLADAPAADSAPVTVARAHEGAWHCEVPLRGRVLHALLHASDRVPASAAEALLTNAVPGKAAAPRSHSLENGRRSDAWRGNCVAIGAAAGFLEPLGSTGLQLIDSGVARLLALFPDTTDLDLMAREYSRAIGAEYDGARDFVVLHHALGRTFRGGSMPDSLNYRRELFEHRGRVVLHDEEIFEEADWACAFIGLGVRPRRHALLADQPADAALNAQVAKISKLMRDAVQQMPPHRAYLERYLA